MTNLNNIFQTQALSWTNLNTFFSWGLPLSNPNYPETVGIFRSDDMALNLFFNTFRFDFSVSQDTPLNLKLRVILRLDAETNSQVLEGSLAENLPDFDIYPVKCVVDIVNPSQKRVICDNIGTLK